MSSADQQDQLLIYQTEDGSFQTEVRIGTETVWLAQKQLSALFGTSTDNIGLHLKNIYAEGELDEDSTTEGFSLFAKRAIEKLKGALNIIIWTRLFQLGTKLIPNKAPSSVFG